VLEQAFCVTDRSSFVGGYVPEQHHRRTLVTNPAWRNALWQVTLFSNFNIIRKQTLLIEAYIILCLNTQHYRECHSQLLDNSAISESNGVQLRNHHDIFEFET
jgi:hypothetical protein